MNLQNAETKAFPKIYRQPSLSQKLKGLISIKHAAVACFVALGLVLGAQTTPVKAAESDDVAQKTGRETGLALPRFVSLKSKTVNLRVGPGRKYPISWQYQRRGLPVEVIQEFDQWRRIRDADGATGWVLHSLLSSKRTAVIAPWEKVKVEFGKPATVRFFDGKKSAHNDARTVARLQPGLIVDVSECAGKWCSVEAQKTHFWLKQDSLWGVYPDENFEG